MVEAYLFSAFCIFIIFTSSQHLGVMGARHINLPLSALIETIAGMFLCIIPALLAMEHFLIATIPMDSLKVVQLLLWTSSIYLAFRFFNSWWIIRCNKRRDDYINSLPVQLPLGI